MKEYRKEMLEGFQIVFHSLLAFLLLGSILANFAIGATMAVLPAYADELGGVHMYGYMLAALSTGSLTGSTFSHMDEEVFDG